MFYHPNDLKADILHSLPSDIIRKSAAELIVLNNDGDEIIILKSRSDKRSYSKEEIAFEFVYYDLKQILSYNDIPQVPQKAYIMLKDLKSSAQSAAHELIQTMEWIEKLVVRYK